LANIHGLLGNHYRSAGRDRLAVFEHGKGVALAGEAITRGATHARAHAEFVHIYGLYGNSLHESGQFREADAAFRTALRDVEAFDFDHEDWLRTFTELAANARYAFLLRDAGRYQEAAKHLQVARRLAEHGVSSAKNEGAILLHQYWIAIIEYTLGELEIIHRNADAALAHLQIASDLLETRDVPGNIWREYALGHVHFQCAVALTQLGRFEDAISAYEEAQQYWRSTGIQIGADWAASSQARVGELYYAFGQPNEGDEHLTAALRQFDETTRSLPVEPNAHNPLIVFLCMCANPQLRDPERAVRLAERFISANDSNGPFWRYLGLARYRVGNWEGAEDAVRRGAELRNGADALDLLLLAAINHHAGDHEEARSAYEQASIALDAGNPIFYDQIDPHCFETFRAEVESLLSRSTAETVENP
jgi:tetratricopeptide (TPR) repeat protein